MPNIDTLPAQFQQQRVLLQAQLKSEGMQIGIGTQCYDQIIKTSVLEFLPGSTLIFEDLSFPWIIVYADIWRFNGYAEIRRTSRFDLSGPNGAPAAPTPPTRPGTGIPGNSGAYGMPGRDGTPGFTIPQLFIFGQQMEWNGNQAVPEDVNVLVNFDGYDGGNGGNGGAGGNGTDGTRGEHSVDGWLDCSAGPGRGGRGGNAGVGGLPGYGADGGDANSVFMFVDPQQVAVFTRVTVSLNGGKPGVDGRRGNNGIPGRGGKEGPYSGNCGPAGRDGANGFVPVQCPFPEVRKYKGADAAPPSIIGYTGFAELQQ